MNAYIFLVALVCLNVVIGGHVAYYDVGSVLFSPSDLKKQQWTNSEMGLLRARKEFLEVIPPLNYLNTQNEDFAKSVFEYFENTFLEVNNEAPDPKTNGLLKSALSDAVGGYLKMWILPITKLGYYGGTVPQDDALRLFKFHEDLKHYLKTDGRGWHSPDTDYLKSITINVAPVSKISHIESAKSCDDLAYFEKTDSGLAIPVPVVNWQNNIECMSIPLKNQPPVSLNCPNSSAALFTYYNTAKNCINTNSIEDENSYNERLQNWLEDDVVPHLSDEKLYPGLQSILTLVNRTRTLCDSVLDLKAGKSYYFNRSHIAGIPVDLSSKKMMVITVIIFLEIAWCIPTLCYLMVSKIRKKKFGNQNNVYFFIEPKNRRDKQGEAWANYSQCTTTNRTQVSSKEVTASPSKKSTCVGQSFHTRSDNTVAHHNDISRHSIGAGTRSNFVCQLQPFDIDKSVHTTSLKASLPNITRPRDDSSNHKMKPCSSTHICKCNCGTLSNTSSLIALQNLQATKTVTILQNHGRDNGTFNFDDEPEKDKTINDNKEYMESKRLTKKRASSSTTDSCRGHPRKSSKESQSLSIEKASKTTMKHQIYTYYKATLPQNDTFKGNSSTKPNLQSNNNTKSLEAQCLKTKKPSKIPKRFLANSVTQTMCSPLKNTLSHTRTTLIPQPQHPCTMDDIVILSSRKSNDAKMNDTF